jgi:hypothetical protein
MKPLKGSLKETGLENFFLKILYKSIYLNMEQKWHLRRKNVMEYGTKMASKKEKCHDAPKKIKRSKKAEISSMTDKFYSFDWNNPELQGQKPLAEVYDPNVFWHNISNQYFPFTSYGVF